jgi:hypothetical protein
LKSSNSEASIASCVWSSSQSARYISCSRPSRCCTICETASRMRAQASFSARVFRALSCFQSVSGIALIARKVRMFLVSANARFQARGMAGARYERTLFPVACIRLILIEAPSSTYPSGTAGIGKNAQGEEETSGASPPHSTRHTVASTSMPAPCLSAACTRMVKSCCTAP